MEKITAWLKNGPNDVYLEEGFSETNTDSRIVNLLEDFKIGFGKYPNVVQFDDGKEFHNVGVKRLLEGKKIRYFSTKSDKKAAVVERFNRTLKTMMWKYFYKSRGYNWLDVLDKLVENYNTKHRSIGMKPSEVNEENEFEV